MKRDRTSLNILRCHECLKKKRIECAGLCPCPYDPDGRDVGDHAVANYCPKNFYAAGGPRPHNWHLQPARDGCAVNIYSPAVQASYRQFAADAIAAIPPCPDAGAGRGIIVVGGGRYFISALTNIRQIRRLGCDLPILLVGMDGELPPWQRNLAERDGAICATWGELAPAHPRGRVHGWELKTVAALYSPFAQTLILDADSFPQRDPITIFDDPHFLEHGAVYWPDLPDPKGKHVLGNNMTAAIWEMLGVAPRDIPALESGQQLVDKSKWWRGLWMSNWLCRHGWNYYFNFLTWYGDKNCPQAAAALLGIEYASPTHRPTDNGAPMLLQRDFDGSPLFAHYTGPKFWNDWAPREPFADIPLDRLTMEIFHQAREDFRAAQPKPFVAGITISVGYEDYLEATIENAKQLDDWLIVTVAGDPAVELCQKHKLSCLISGDLHKNGSKFNLGALRNAGAAEVARKYAGRDDVWALYLDADCRLPADFMEKLGYANLDRRQLIGAHRRHADGTPSTDWNVTGYFQLFHISHHPARQYRENHIDAGKTDIWFRDLWKSEHLLMLPVTVEHLGRTGIDWEGRLSGPLGSAPAIPLGGDLVEKAAKLVGADKLAAMWEQLTGKSCGCSDRKKWLNDKSLELLKLIGLT